MLQIPNMQSDAAFRSQLRLHYCDPPRAYEVAALQVNLGKLCNQRCRHCHVDAGPHRVEQMSREMIDVVLEVLRRHPTIAKLDITGGAPEMNPHFRRLAGEAAAIGRQVIDRSNLTVFFETGFEDIPKFLASNKIEVIASLPCYLPENVRRIRGEGVYEKSIEALRILNTLGYGHENSPLVLSLMYNPSDPLLPPPQEELEADYRRELKDRFGIVFNRLYTMTNMPIGRFRAELEREGKLADYMERLSAAFNPATIDGLMCRHLVSVSWDGTLYDCDFNQMVGLPLNHNAPCHIRNFNLSLLSTRLITTAYHCFGCTAGSGSSCEGTVVATSVSEK